MGSGDERRGGSPAVEVLRRVHAQPKVTRADVARDLGLTTGTATEVVARLRQQHLLQESPAPPTGARGRPDDLPVPRIPRVRSSSPPRSSTTAGWWPSSRSADASRRSAEDVTAATGPRRSCAPSGRASGKPSTQRGIASERSVCRWPVPSRTNGSPSSTPWAGATSTCGRPSRTPPARTPGHGRQRRLARRVRRSPPGRGHRTPRRSCTSGSLPASVVAWSTTAGPSSARPAPPASSGTCPSGTASAGAAAARGAAGAPRWTGPPSRGRSGLRVPRDPTGYGLQVVAAARAGDPRRPGRRASGGRGPGDGARRPGQRPRPRRGDGRRPRHRRPGARGTTDAQRVRLRAHGLPTRLAAADPPVRPRRERSAGRGRRGRLRHLLHRRGLEQWNRLDR